MTPPFDLSAFPCTVCGEPAAAEHYNRRRKRLWKLCATHKAAAQLADLPLTASTPLWFLDFCAGSGTILCHAVRTDPALRATRYPTPQRPLCGARIAGGVQDPLGNGHCRRCTAILARVGHALADPAAWPGYR